MGHPTAPALGISVAGHILERRDGAWLGEASEKQVWGGN